MIIKKIISGGQTGADLAALDFAMANNMLYGGWCPKGRKCESGLIPDKFILSEMKTADYPSRTRKNITESDGTLVFIDHKTADRGTKLTIELCRKSDKPCLVIDLSDVGPKQETVVNWISGNKIIILNIAGNRESISPGIHDKVLGFLEKCLC